MTTSKLPISDFRLPICLNLQGALKLDQIGNRQLAIGNYLALSLFGSRVPELSERP